MIICNFIGNNNHEVTNYKNRGKRKAEAGFVLSEPSGNCRRRIDERNRGQRTSLEKSFLSFCCGGIRRGRLEGQLILSDETKPQDCRRKTLGVNSGASRPSTYHYLPAIIVWIFKKLCDTMLSIKVSETII